MIEEHNGYSVRAFLTGACIGAGVALLYAPQTGARLRRTIRTRANRAGEEFRDVWETAQEESRAYLESGMAALKKAGEVVESAVELGSDLVETGRSALNDVTKELKHSRR